MLIASLVLVLSLADGLMPTNEAPISDRCTNGESPVPGTLWAASHRSEPWDRAQGPGTPKSTTGDLLTDCPKGIDTGLDHGCYD